MRRFLINAKDLKSELTMNPSIRVINSTLARPLFDMDHDAIYKNERIPKASFLNIDKVTDHTQSVPHQVPTEEQFFKQMKKVDISHKDEIVLYDDHAVAGAARMWWVFRTFGKKVHVLDGGLNAWKREDGVIETGEPRYKHRRALKDEDYKFTKAKERVFDFKDINALSYLIGKNKESENYEIVDARSSDRFYGRAPEPRRKSNF